MNGDVQSAVRVRADGHLEVDLTDTEEAELACIVLDGIETVDVILPLPSFNNANSYIDLCEDLLEASWAAERLSGCAKRATAVQEQPKGTHAVRVRLTLHSPGAALSEELRACAVAFRSLDEENGEAYARWNKVRDELIAYEETIGDLSPLVPEIVEWYLVNHVHGAMEQIRADAPDYYKTLTDRYPERQVGFHHSPFSQRIGARCFASMGSWLIPAGLDVDRFFEVTGQKSRTSEFMPAEVVVLDGRSYILAGGSVAFFPMNQYFKSRVCASFALRDDDDLWPPNTFSWKDASFTYSEEFEQLRLILSEGIRAPAVRRERCLLHETASLAIIEDGQFSHVLYEIEPLNPIAVKNLHARAVSLSDQLWEAAGPSPSIACDWALLSDEAFEQLCYDVIFNHPKFDRDTIRARKIAFTRRRARH